ncbi:MAG: hypothetical protein IPM63_14650 [Acidobacteriota bacterium]|nr:MAG: hypothetical protein IPM63_14650 [Acidobacteriota bacterium]
MKIKKLTLTVLLVSAILVSGAAAQQTKEWLKALENPTDASERLKPENFLDKYKRHDLSLLLAPHSEFLGFIEPDYQRLYIFYTSISKDAADPALYEVEGFSVAKDNKCRFEGTIKIVQMREYVKPEYGLDDEYKDAGIKARGIAIGEYRFVEEKSQKHSGVFEGVVTMNWYLDRNGILRYDRILFFADGYSNNQYVGTWTAHGAAKGKVANWGEWRIPYSGDLDIGAGEFSPNEKYLKNGWKDMQLH